MPATVRYQVIGADRLARTLRDVGRGLEQDLGPEQDAGARRLAASAGGRAPRRSGRLASSVTGHGTPEAMVVESRLPYAGVQEWGWPARNIRATHYLGEAYRAERAGLVDTLAGGVRRLLARVRGA